MILACYHSRFNLVAAKDLDSMAVNEANAASEHVQKASTILYSIMLVNNSYATLHVFGLQPTQTKEHGLFCLCTDCLSTMNHFCPTAHQKINTSLALRRYAKSAPPSQRPPNPQTNNITLCWMWSETNV